MREYFFKVRKTGTRDTPTKVFGIRNPDAYKRQMKKNGYTIIEIASLKSNWKEIQDRKVVK